MSANGSSKLLANMIDRAVAAVRSLYRNHGIQPRVPYQRALKRLIVHKAPHLDEYLAELCFLACLDEDPSRIDYVEQSIFSRTSDPVARRLWPASVLIGLGSDLAQLGTSLSCFDEHEVGGGRRARSAARLVLDTHCASNGALPLGLRIIARENDFIDSQGDRLRFRAHSFHLCNLIKLLHSSRIVVSRNSAIGHEQLPSTWKRAVVLTALACIIVTIDGEKGWKDNFDGMKAICKRVAARFKQHVALRPEDPDVFGRFLGAISNVQEMLGAKVGNTAGDVMNQHMVLPRVLWAVERCLGPEWADFVGLTLLEPRLRHEIEFSQAAAEVSKAIDEEQTGTSISPLGEITFRKSVWRGKPMAIFGFTTYGGLANPISPMQDAINRFFNGQGVSFLDHMAHGTKAISSGRETDEVFWNCLCRYLQEQEPGKWFRTGKAKFMLNGNEAHRYVDPSNLDFVRLAQTIERI